MVPIGAGQQWRTSWGPAPSWATTRSPERPTFGPVIAKASRLLGRPLFPWQRFVADVAGEVLPDGSAAYSTIVMVVPRRAGKNALVEAKIFQAGTEGPRRTIWMTGQKRDNAVKRWRDVRTSFLTAKNPEVKRLIRSRVSNSFEVIEWPSTASEFRPFAPDEDSIHGEDPDLVFADELWAFSREQRKLIQAGYRPAFAFKPLAQEWLFSAAGRAGRSEWLADERAAGRAGVTAGRTDGVAYFEWSVPEAARDIDDVDRLVELVQAHHPRPGIRTAYLRSEFERDQADFLRAYGTLDDLGANVDLAIPRTVFEAAEFRGPSLDPGPADRVGVGVAVDEDNLASGVAMAWRRADGVVVVRVLEVAPGSRWVPGRVGNLHTDRDQVERVAIANTGIDRDTADVLEPLLGDVLDRVSAADVSAAGSRFVADMEERRLLHDGAVSSELLDALAAAAPPRRGRFEKRAGSLDPIVAVRAAVLAVWAADHLPERKQERPRFTVL